MKKDTKDFFDDDEAMDRAIEKYFKKMLAEKKKKGLPITKCDPETREVYREYPDGRREHV